jgi:uncharacterized protein with von Willebrand factor type A (vWA) domain
VKNLEQLAVYDREFMVFLTASPLEAQRSEVSTSNEDSTTSMDDTIDGVENGRMHEGDPKIDESRGALIDTLPQNDPEKPLERETASSVEVLRTKDFENLSEEESDALNRLIGKLNTTPPMRVSRRTRSATTGASLDLRRMLNDSMRTEGEPVVRRWQRRQKRPRGVVFLLDISASMKAYSRSLLLFSYVVRRRNKRTEVFCFGTSLTHISRTLDLPTPDQALDAVGRLIRDWEGGTRISHSIDAFIKDWGGRGLARGAVVVICSDGLEGGDPTELGRQMSRLRALCHAIVWVNPLKSSADYRPLTGGMKAALPYVDTLMSGHSLASLEELSDTLASI